MELSKTRKNTTDLLRDLKQSEKFSDFVKKNGKSLKHGEFTETLNRYFRSQGRSKAEIARAAGISEAYLYQICSGTRVPSRNLCQRQAGRRHSSWADARDRTEQSQRYTV